MASNMQMYNFAKKYLGKGGSLFRMYCNLPSGAAWCNAYVTYIFHKTSNAKLYCDGKKETYCPHSIKWCEKNLAQIPLYLAMPMDVIYFDWEKNGTPNHIGFVRSRRSADTIYTIEGNTDGGKVANKTRAGKYVQAVYRPHYKPATTLKEKLLTIDGQFDYQSIFMLQTVLGLKADGILGKKTVKAWQKRVGVTQDGAFGVKTVKATQRLLKVTQDGVMGKKTVEAWQNWINKAYKPSSYKPVPDPNKKGYQGTFPTLPPKTAKIAVECAYAYGTKLSKYRYKGGKPKEAYKKRLNQAYPNRSGWKYAKSRAGASCDVFAGTDLRCSGYKDAPHAMSQMVNWCRKNLKSVTKMQNGDILTRTNHVMICVDLKGKMRVANAHFQDHGGTYGIIQSVGKHTHIWRPTGTSYFSKGDTFTDVKKLQKFLNWYGQYDIKEDYVFGTKTEEAVCDFQTKEGLNVTGRFGPDELKKAKVVTR